MKFKKVFAVIGALCLSATLLTSVFVGAVNFDKATYAEGNPTYVEIISKNENELVFGPTADNMAFKAQLHASDLVGQENVSKIRNIKMTITYSNTAKVPTSYVGGGVWTKPGEVQWGLSMMDAETGEYKEASYDVELKFLLDSNLFTADQEAIVIQDWSYKSASEATQLENAKMKTNGFQIKVTNLKIYSDVAGTQEMELMPYGYPEVAAVTTTAAPAETTVAATTTAAATTTTGAVAGTTTTAAKSTNPTTGEKGIAIAIASLMAAAGVAVIFKKDRK